MPVSVVVGGQYGSEGKGKVAFHVAQSTAAAAVVRVGGPNSGHSAVDEAGKLWMFRQLPASSLAKKAAILLPAGSLIDPEILKAEISEFGLDPKRLLIDENASVVLEKHRIQEANGGLRSAIGSTNSGTGAALSERISRGDHGLAKNDPFLKHFVHPFLPDVMRTILNNGQRIVIEGTQGFGLSIWHGGSYPFATSRDTTAANFVAEAGLAPQDVDDVVLTIRSFPIRVGGNSGPLENEIDWQTLAMEADLPPGHIELTSATKRVRRVARFHPDVVRRAIVVNNPHRIVLNHMDYVDPSSKFGSLTKRGYQFIYAIEEMIGRKVDLIGTSPKNLFAINRKLAKQA